MNSTKILRTPPTYCHYADGECDQVFSNTPDSEAVFLYPADPEWMARTIEMAAEILNKSNDNKRWRTWREFQSAGQIVFCTICKNMRFSNAIIADVTTLNFNLMFEIGFALGLEIPLLLIRDTSFMRDSEEFKKLGILESITYLDFQNAKGLARAVRSAMPAVKAIPAQSVILNRDMPLYLVKSHISTEGQLKLTSIIDRSPLKFRSYDPIEDPPLSLHDMRKQVATSFGVIGHLLTPDRDGAIIHNARCALIAGMAVAAGKVVVLFQEGNIQQPIDYRDLVLPYTNPQQLDSALEAPIRRILDRLLDSGVAASRPPRGLLEKLDLGDIAAENEIQQLRDYFVQTGQYNEARRGHVRLVIGRKGSGKTAIFYAVRNSIPKTRNYLVLDMKPEGHQFTKLREEVLASLPTKGLQEHTLAAFWNYILLCELCRDIINKDLSWAQRDSERYQTFCKLRDLFEDLVPDDSGDFSERLLHQVNRLSEHFSSVEELTSARITEVLFKTEIPKLEEIVANYLAHKSQVWMLIDNLDKGWPIRGASPEDILIIRALLDATRKIKQKLERKGVGMHSLVFLRNDIYDLLLQETSDRDKDTPVIVDWDDPEAFKELVLQRIKVATGLNGSFDDVWSAAFERSVGTQDSFVYVVERTLMRPRDLIRFLRKAVEVAVNRGHKRVEAGDFITANDTYSEELLSSINYELSDVSPKYKDLVYEFIGCNVAMSVSEATNLISAAVGNADYKTALQFLIWFGFLGMLNESDDEPQFAYNMRYNLAKIETMLKRGMAQLVVHPAFRMSLGCQ